MRIPTLPVMRSSLRGQAFLISWGNKMVSNGAMKWGQTQNIKVDDLLVSCVRAVFLRGGAAQRSEARALRRGIVADVVLTEMA